MQYHWYLNYWQINNYHKLFLAELIRESGRTPTHNLTMAIELLIKFRLNNGAEKVLENIIIEILALTC